MYPGYNQRHRHTHLPSTCTRALLNDSPHTSLPPHTTATHTHTSTHTIPRHTYRPPHTPLSPTNSHTPRIQSTHTYHSHTHTYPHTPLTHTHTSVPYTPPSTHLIHQYTPSPLLVYPHRQCNLIVAVPHLILFILQRFYRHTDPPHRPPSTFSSTLAAMIRRICCAPMWMHPHWRATLAVCAASKSAPS